MRIKLVLSPVLSSPVSLAGLSDTPEQSFCFAGFRVQFHWWVAQYGCPKPPPPSLALIASNGFPFICSPPTCCLKKRFVEPLFQSNLFSNILESFEAIAAPFSFGHNVKFNLVSLFEGTCHRWKRESYFREWSQKITYWVLELCLLANDSYYFTRSLMQYWMPFNRHFIT